MEYYKNGDLGEVLKKQRAKSEAIEEVVRTLYMNFIIFKALFLQKLLFPIIAVALK